MKYEISRICDAVSEAPYADLKAVAREVLNALVDIADNTFSINDVADALVDAVDRLEDQDKAEGDE